MSVHNQPEAACLFFNIRGRQLVTAASCFLKTVYASLNSGQKFVLVLLHTNRVYPVFYRVCFYS